MSGQDRGSATRGSSASSTMPTRQRSWRARGFYAPQIAVINGMTKPVGELFSDREYKTNVRDLGDEYRSTFPRRIAEP